MELLYKLSHTVSIECVGGDLEFVSICSALLASLIFSGISHWTSQCAMQLPENIISRYIMYTITPCFLVHVSHILCTGL